MQVQFYEFSIARDTTTVIFLKAPKYEAAVLANIFGKERVKNEGDGPVVDVAPEDEVQRMANKYSAGTLFELFGADYEARIIDMIEKCQIAEEEKAPAKAKTSATAAK